MLGNIVVAWSVASVMALALIAAAVVIAQLRKRLLDAQLRTSEVMQQADERQAQLKELSGVDVLTGIPGRRVFDEALHREWTRGLRNHQPLAVLMVDIDRFKLHNDTYGHQAGDECLRQVAAVLKSCVRRPTDVLARYGGEEFGVVLPGVSATGAMAVAEQMRRAIEAIRLAHVNSPVGHDVTISVGVALMFPAKHLVATALVAAADEALYTAKAVGRNQVILADTEQTVDVA